jgi:hypothetical protein
MNDLELAVFNAIDIKEILSGIIYVLKMLCSSLPTGEIKDIICGFAALLSVLLAKLPS